MLDPTRIEIDVHSMLGLGPDAGYEDWRNAYRQVSPLPSSSHHSTWSVCFC
jgi:hypothetical protein